MPPLEKPNNRYILKRFLSSSLPFGLLPLCFLDHLSLLYLLLFSSPPPLFFFITPSFSEWAALRLLGFVEVYQKHVWRFGGGWWEVLRQAAHPHSSQRARASGEEKLLVSSKTESYWVFLQDIIFHWTDKQEKQLEDWKHHPPRPTPSQRSATTLQDFSRCVILLPSRAKWRVPYVFGLLYNEKNDINSIY